MQTQNLVQTADDRVFDMGNPQDVARYLRRNPFTTVGGYELYLITEDGEILCGDCVAENYDQIYTAKSGDGGGWTAAGITGNHAMGEADWCSHCSREVGPESEVENV